MEKIGVTLNQTYTVVLILCCWKKTGILLNQTDTELVWCNSILVEKTGITLNKSYTKLVWCNSIFVEKTEITFKPDLHRTRTRVGFK